MSTEDRLDHCDRVLSAWEALGQLGGRPEDNLRMIREQLALLAKIDDPIARALERRFSVMVNRIRVGLS